MISKDFEAIAKEDIEALVTNAVSERRTIEYKEKLPGGTDEEKKEFLADASSFANAGGGDLIYGIREKRNGNGKSMGIPDAAEGLAGRNADLEVRRLEDMLRAGLDPRIPAVRIKSLGGFPAGPVILLRIPKSWASPHMVSFKNSSRFFSRTSAGKHQLDVREIRASFIASNSLGERMSAFRSDRIGKVLTGETPVLLEPNPKVILHLLPISAFAESLTIDLKTVQALPNSDFYLMGSQGSKTPRFNFDGYLLYDEMRVPERPLCCSYVQLFRNGIIEAVWTNFVREQALLIGPLERELLKALPKHLKLQQKLGIESPLFVAISLVGAKNLVILTNDQIHCQLFSRPIDRDVLLTAEVSLEEAVSNLDYLLRPAFDTIWQAGGWPRSLGYDESGKRVGSVNYDL